MSMEKLTMERIIGGYLFVVGLIALCGNALGLSVIPSDLVAGITQSNRPVWLTILLFPYFLLQNIILVLVPIHVWSYPYQFMGTLIFGYLPALIWLILGYVLLKR